MTLLIEDAYELYHEEMTRHVARHFGGTELARDAVQQAYMKAFLHQWELGDMPEQAAKAWLYATARNAAIDMLRKEKRLTYDYDFDSLPAKTADAADNAALREGIEKLEGLQRMLVDMRYYKGHNSSEISGMTGMPASTVRYHLMNAIRELRKQLKEEE